MPQLTLKRALKLRKELEAVISKLEVPTSVKISLLNKTAVSDPQRVVEEGYGQLTEALNTYDQLSDILASIRIKIAAQNIRDIEPLLASIADIDRKMAIRRKITGAATTPPADELAEEVLFAVRALEASHTAENHYHRPAREITVSAIGLTMRENAQGGIIAMKRLRESLEDQRTAINATTYIEIADDATALLQKVGLL